MIVSPKISMQKVEVNIVLMELVYSSADKVKAKVKRVILNYIDSLRVSENIRVIEIVRRVGMVAGVRDVEVVLPATDTELMSDQVARTSYSNIVVNLVSS